MGENPPSSLNLAWVEAIKACERDGLTDGSWTLTWLEGYPRVVHDSGREAGIGGTPSDDEEW